MRVNRYHQLQQLGWTRHPVLGQPRYFHPLIKSRVSSFDNKDAGWTLHEALMMAGLLHKRTE